jgi:hypothetical protein
MTIASRTVAALAALVLTLLAPSAAQAADRPVPDRSGTLTVDVAEDGTRFVFDEAPVFDDGYPAYGNGFVTQGYIYPAGTLDGHNGVNPDGSPEFPDLVVGTWTCYGSFIGNGAYTEEGPWVITTQVFDFGGAEVGGDTIVTVGYETPAGQPIAVRAVVGGTGRFSSVGGDVDQITLGHNASDGVDAGFTFDLNGIDRRAAETVARVVRGSNTPQPI